MAQLKELCLLLLLRFFSASKKKNLFITVLQSPYSSEEMSTPNLHKEYKNRMDLWISMDLRG